MKKRYYITPKLELDNTELFSNLHKEKKDDMFLKRIY